MKIVYCIPDTFRPGGIERMLSIKASYLAEKNNGDEYEVFIITTGQCGKESYYTFSDKIKFIDLGINYEEALNVSFLKRIVFRQKKRKEHKRKLSKILGQLSADVVISTFTHESSFLPSIKDGSKKILEFHFSKGYKIKQAIYGKESILLKAAHFYLSFVEERITASKYDAFVVLTEEDRMRWKPVVPNVQAIPNILSIQTEKKAVLENHIALAVGRLSSQKGFDKLIKLWISIKQECPDWQLHIIGSGEDEYMLKGLIKKYGLSEQITIFAASKNIIEHYMKASIFLMTSRFEGFPMVLLEAMGCGLPCITYNYHCGPSEIIQSGKNGYLVEDNNEYEFIKHTLLLMKDQNLRTRLGARASIDIQSYTQDAIMKKWINLIHQITDKTK